MSESERVIEAVKVMIQMAYMTIDLVDVRIAEAHPVVEVGREMGLPDSTIIAMLVKILEGKGNDGG